MQPRCRSQNARSSETWRAVAQPQQKHSQDTTRPRSHMLAVAASARSCDTKRGATWCEVRWPRYAPLSTGRRREPAMGAVSCCAPAFSSEIPLVSGNVHHTKTNARKQNATNRRSSPRSHVRRGVWTATHAARERTAPPESSSTSSPPTTRRRPQPAPPAGRALKS